MNAYRKNVFCNKKCISKILYRALGKCYFHLKSDAWNDFVCRGDQPIKINVVVKVGT